MLSAKEISWDLSLKCISDGYPILHPPRGHNETEEYVHDTWGVFTMALQQCVRSYIRASKEDLNVGPGGLLQATVGVLYFHKNFFRKNTPWYAMGSAR